MLRIMQTLSGSSNYHDSFKDKDYLTYMNLVITKSKGVMRRIYTYIFLIKLATLTYIVELVR